MAKKSFRVVKSMSRIAPCPNCQKPFSLPEIASSVTIACPYCKSLITLSVKPNGGPVAYVVPVAKTKVRPASEEEEDDEEVDTVRSSARRKGRSSKKTSSGRGKKIGILVSILLVTMLCIGGVLWFVMSPDQKSGNNYAANPAARKLYQVEEPPVVTEVAEATGSEKFEIPDKALIQSDFYQSFVPNSKLPGLETNAIKDGSESLSADVLNRVKSSTVYIESSREQGMGSGSGFFAFDRGLIVTNAHVIDMLDENKPEAKNIRVFLNHGARNQKDYKVVKVLKVDRKHDLAILQLPPANLSEYPEPMKLASSQTAHETQKVYSLGFPFGNSAGKEVTVTSIAVSSFRYQDGHMKLVQFGGASLNPGNSGGPIVDASGRVVSVAVSIFTGRDGEGAMTNTGISFGVPADEAAALFFGRPDRLEFFPLVRKGDTIRLPVVFRLSEHSSRNAEPRVMVQTGDEKKPPENTSVGEQPSLKSGDNKQLYTGSLVLPELQDGKVYWIQSQMTVGDNQTNIMEPMMYTPGKILDDNELPSSVAGGATLGALKLKQRYQYVVNTNRGSLAVRLDYEVNTSGGTQPLKNLRVGARADDRPLAHQTLQQIWSNRISEEGDPQASRKLTAVLQTNLNRWHDLAQLDIPNEKIAVGKTWKVKQRPVTLDYLFGFDGDQSSSLSCEYLGSFKEGNRLIGAIRIQGDIGEAQNLNAKYGKFSGIALVEANSRQLLDMMLRCDVRKRTTGSNALRSPISVDGVMQLRLQRSS